MKVPVKKLKAPIAGSRFIIDFGFPLREYGTVVIINKSLPKNINSISPYGLKLLPSDFKLTRWVNGKNVLLREIVEDPDWATLYFRISAPNKGFTQIDIDEDPTSETQLLAEVIERGKAPRAGVVGIISTPITNPEPIKLKYYMVGEIMVDNEIVEGIWEGEKIIAKYQRRIGMNQFSLRMVETKVLLYPLEGELAEEYYRYLEDFNS